MEGMSDLIHSENDGSLSFGNYDLKEKKKLEDYSHEGDLYKVKTFSEMTKLERNGMFVYESEPGTNVENFFETNSEIRFQVKGTEDTEITLGLEEDADYEVLLDDVSSGNMKTNRSGKLTVSVELSEGKTVQVRIVKH